MEAVRTATLVLAVLLTGLMDGVFLLYSNAIMPGLRRTDDRTFVSAFQAMDRAIVNPAFLAVFLGAAVFTGLAAGLHLTAAGVRPWLIAAFVLYLVAVVVTVRVHVPLNDALKAAGPPDRITDLAGVRQAFDESLWLAWNHVRAAATTLAFGCLVWATVRYGRSGG